MDVKIPLDVLNGLIAKIEQLCLEIEQLEAWGTATQLGVLRAQLQSYLVDNLTV